jgi:hypothetical protein
MRAGKSGAAFRRWGYVAWVVLIAAFAVLHALNLRADFPNHSAWTFDWAKYTDEGWYGNAAIRAHLFGNWYMAGDFNPAVAVPVWPFVEWVLFFFTGVTIEAARGLAVACFFANLVLSYALLRVRGSKPMALAAVTLVATSPFLYCFSRLAILEPLQTTLFLIALNLAVRLNLMRRPGIASAGVGALLAMTMLTKTTALFLLPAVLWVIVLVLWQKRWLALRCALTATAAMGLTYGAWLAMIAARGLMGDYRYYFYINTYDKPTQFYWPLLSLWWSVHGVWWVDHNLILLACVMALGSVVACRTAWGRKLWSEPLYGCSLLTVAGYVLFMALQNHPQPRYYAVPAVFCMFLVALTAEALLRETGWVKTVGWVAVVAIAAAVAEHGVRVAGFAAHPEYTYVNAAAQLTQYIDAHPNGRRLVVSISGDDLTLMTHLPTLCDDFGTEPLVTKLGHYQPGWYASWNDLDPGTLEDLHSRYSLEQVAVFDALDDPERNRLVLFKLHPLAGGRVRDASDENLKDMLPDDRFDVPVE